MRRVLLVAVGLAFCAESASARGLRRLSLTQAFGADDDDESTATDVDCVMNAWGGWSKCSAQCDCGLKQNYRTVKVQPKGHGKACPYSDMASTCNCQDCVHGDAIPASSSHGFVPEMYRPEGDFKSKDAEQGACLLDKAAAIVDLYLATQTCEEWNAELGSACYPDGPSHLVGKIKECCQGRDHFKQWQSDVLCTRLTGGVLHALQHDVIPAVEGCIKATDRGGEKVSDAVPECRAFKSKKFFHETAKVTVHALDAARQLYARAPGTDLNAAASEFLHTCDVIGKVEDSSGRVVESWSSPEVDKCKTKVARYVKHYSPSGAVKEDQEGASGVVVTKGSGLPHN